MINNNKMYETIERMLKEDLKTYKSRQEHALFIQLSEGNKKLKPNKRVGFLIWNLPAVITCPFRTIHCEGACYALKAEKQYKDSCVNSRMRHLELSKDPSFVSSMIFTIKAELDRPINKNRKVVFRIHESGDFYNKAYVEKWLEIMRYFEDTKNLVFVAYTKSVKFFDGVDLPTNFHLLASVWDDTKESNLDIIKRNNFRIYTAYQGEMLEAALLNGFAHCPCDDCANCGKCWNSFTNNIACEIH